MKRALILGVIFILILTESVFYGSLGSSYFNEVFDSNLKLFSSYDQLKDFINLHIEWGHRIGILYQLYGPAPIFSTQFLDKGSAPESNMKDYSGTNVQVEGVDEADIVKTDGKYIYLVANGNSIYIVKAFPPENISVKSVLHLNGTLLGLFVYGDKLIVFEQFGLYRILESSEKGNVKPLQEGIYIKIFDVSDRTNPIQERKIALNGWYLSSRMVNEYLYVVINSPAVIPIDYQKEKYEVDLPHLYYDDKLEIIPADEIYYSNVSDIFNQYTVILSINLLKDWMKPNHKVILTGTSSCMYMSYKNIYVVMTSWARDHENTVIHRIAFYDGAILPVVSGSIPGRVLNQFSMDEYNEHFRIATTTSYLARSISEATSSNHIYVLDMALNVTGRLEDIAPGERIYSARFMGDRCYLVTFRKIDPLFVVDLKNPENPRILGRLKIPGYSDYLHPYDDTHIIGIGKETVPADEGDFSWYQGIKIALFDVSDPENPKDISKIVIGDRGSDSPILRDHHALLFSKERSLLAFPILVAKIDPKDYPNGVPPHAYGKYVWQGLYVFNVSSDGSSLRGRITHIDDHEDFIKSGYYFYSPYSITRSLYIDGVLYTISDRIVKANDISTLNEIAMINLPVDA